VRDAGGVWAADSPRLLFDLIDTLDDVGLPQVISEYFEERPAMSVNKCTLRRVGRTEASPNWHQDGAFLGDGIRSIDVWISLSTCGVDAPGLDVVPRRLDRVVETGTGGAVFDWAVGRAVVEEVAGATGVVRPTFEPGDVLLFDEMLLHNTAVEDSMTRERYAVEAWFFAPSVYPDSQIPLAY
jgi:ectoine hydroxylase-related dioxygenase (phytanoyl-CoA dioxygenase family)